MISDDYWGTNHPISQAEKAAELKRDKDISFACRSRNRPRSRWPI
jgi:hypothetical protein